MNDSDAGAANEPQGIARIAAAFDRLTDAIKLKVKQNNRLIALLVVVVVLNLINTARQEQTIQGLKRNNQATLDQSRQNQDHIDCVVAVFTRQDAPKCRGIRDQLIRDGIQVPTTTTTTTPRLED